MYHEVYYNLNAGESMFDFIINNGTLVGEEKLINNRSLVVSGGKIVSLEQMDAAAAVESIDAAGLIIAPGFIDLHVHGADGADILDCDPGSLQRIAGYHGRHGTTAMLATVAPSTLERMALALETAARHTTSATGASIIGANLEGPFLNRSHSGALGIPFLREPDKHEMNELLAAGQGKVRMVSLVPELTGALEVMELLSSCGVIPSLGHSGATFTQTINAARAGLKHITHIFNAMAPIHHREPGPAGAALVSPELSVEVIADGIHVHPAMLQLLWHIKGDRLVLVSDAIAAAGLPDGRYRFGGQEIVVKGSRAEIPGGRLAGSTITMLDAVRNMVKIAGLKLPQAVRLASANPAAVLGLQKKGRLAPGYDADLVLLDTNLDPFLVMVEGRTIFRRAEKVLE